LFSGGYFATEVVLFGKIRLKMRLRTQYSCVQKIPLKYYKSPNVSVSIYDYYKTRAYGWLSGSFNRIDFENMSLTIATTKHPFKLMSYLRDCFGISLIQNGIYTPHTLKFVFRYKRDFRDNKDFKDMINNKNRSKTDFSSVMSI
jgi:hypothetical protein